MKPLSNEERILYDHLTRHGTPHELVERRQALHAELSADGPRPPNRKAKLAALANLHDQINPPKSNQDMAAKDQETVLNIARRLRNKGDDEGAKRVMIQAQIDPTLLGDRNAPPDFQDRVTAAQQAYRERRHEGINDVKKFNHGWSDQQAQEYFDHRGHKHGMSLDDQLKVEINRNHQFPADRQIDAG